jgi:diketogulonate reductase-like aldo/keto reductase
VINCPEHGVVLISQTEESGVQRPANLVLSPLQGGILQAQPHADDLHALGVQTWPQAVLKWVASDARVSCVLTATHLREHAIENAEAGMPPWFDADQRAIARARRAWRLG